ncbi:hypothetical protein F5X99DRAFT_406942 [Biscogniauxia marginata]|nr:hypothetical protein F5X99DRAFT_406942 [Biscogniauxia marginata]
MANKMVAGRQQFIVSESRSAKRKLWLYGYMYFRTYHFNRGSPAKSFPYDYIIVYMWLRHVTEESPKFPVPPPVTTQLTSTSSILHPTTDRSSITPPQLQHPSPTGDDDSDERHRDTINGAVFAAGSLLPSHTNYDFTITDTIDPVHAGGLGLSSTTAAGRRFGVTCHSLKNRHSPSHHNPSSRERIASHRIYSIHSAVYLIRRRPARLFSPEPVAA